GAPQPIEHLGERTRLALGALERPTDRCGAPKVRREELHHLSRTRLIAEGRGAELLSGRIGGAEYVRCRNAPLEGRQGAHPQVLLRAKLGEQRVDIDRGIKTIGIQGRGREQRRCPIEKSPQALENARPERRIERGVVDLADEVGDLCRIGHLPSPFESAGLWGAHPTSTAARWLLGTWPRPQLGSSPSPDRDQPNG